jgi:chromosome partitioning protein
MRQVAILTQKAGAGKTTPARRRAVAAREAGEKAFVVGLDPIRSRAGCGEKRRAGLARGEGRGQRRACRPN